MPAVASVVLPQRGDDPNHIKYLWSHTIAVLVAAAVTILGLWWMNRLPKDQTNGVTPLLDPPSGTSAALQEPLSHTFSDWATVAVALLAAVTILKTIWDDRQRRKEREAEQREREDVAYAAEHAEYFRLWTVSEEWRAAHLDDPAVVAAKSAEDILPRDWPSLTQNLAQLGLLPAHLGGFGLALAHNACRPARRSLTK